MAKDLNQCNFIGRLGSDPDMRSMPNGDQVANISIAVNDDYRDKETGNEIKQTEWVRVVAYRRLAEVMGQYLRKGSKVFISGRMKTRKWTDNQGIERYTTEIIANDMQMLDSRGDSDGYQQQSAPPRASESNAYAQEKGGHKRQQLQKQEGNFDDDQIPF